MLRIIVLPFNSRMFYDNILFLVLGSKSKERKIAQKLLARLKEALLQIVCSLQTSDLVYIAFLPDPRGPAYTSLFNFCPSVRPSAPSVRPSVAEIKFWSLHILEHSRTF